MLRVLIVDDDPVSLHFLAAAVGSLGCNVVAAASGARALGAALAGAFDLLLLDRRMPDMSGAQLLTALRANRVAAPAIATSAEVDAAISADLRAAGFVDVLAKPLTIACLLACLRPYLERNDVAAKTPLPLLDDVAAAAAIGNGTQVLRALRRLFADELAELESELQRNNQVIDQDRLHRLRASCGFCGATALGEAAQRLQTAQRCDDANAQMLLHEFLQLCRHTREQLASVDAVH